MPSPYAHPYERPRPRPRDPEPVETTTYRIITTRPGPVGTRTHADTHHGIARIEWGDTFLQLIDGEGSVRTLYATGTVLQVDRLDDERAEHDALMSATVTAEQLRRIADRLDQDDAQNVRVAWLPDIVKAIGEPTPDEWHGDGYRGIVIMHDGTRHRHDTIAHLSIDDDRVVTLIDRDGKRAGEYGVTDVARVELTEPDGRCVAHRIRRDPDGYRFDRAEQ